jgi:hypothetical protein
MKKFFASIGLSKASSNERMLRIDGTQYSLCGLGANRVSQINAWPIHLSRFRHSFSLNRFQFSK